MCLRPREHTCVPSLPSQGVQQPQFCPCSFSLNSVSWESFHLMPGDLTSFSQIESSGINLSRYVLSVPLDGFVTRLWLLHTVQQGPSFHMISRRGVENPVSLCPEDLVPAPGGPDHRRSPCAPAILMHFLNFITGSA